MRFEHVPIFLVDDDDDDLSSIKYSLRGCGFINKVYTYNSAAEFWEFYKTQLDAGIPSLTILDWNMPVVNGQEILTNLKQDFPDNKAFIVVLSTSNREIDREMALSLGAYEYYVKPSRVERLNSLLLEIKRAAISSGFFAIEQGENNP